MKKRKLFCFFQPTYKNTHRNSLFAHCIHIHYNLISFLLGVAECAVLCKHKWRNAFILFSAVKLDSHEDCCRKSHPIDIESKSWIGNPSHPTGWSSSKARSTVKPTPFLLLQSSSQDGTQEQRLLPLVKKWR